MKAKESRNRILMQLSEIFLEASQLITIFLFIKADKKHLKTICACAERADLILKTLKKNFISWPNPYKPQQKSPFSFDNGLQ
jgi:hypothetical protein